jgi:hypothetical protein
MELKGGDLFGNHRRMLAWLLVVGTLPALVLGLALEQTAEARLRSPLITVFALAVLGQCFFSPREKQTEPHHRDVHLGGFPVDRLQPSPRLDTGSFSKVTMTTAMFRDSTRTDAARFSFLLSTPVIVGAGALEGWRRYRGRFYASGLRAPRDGIFVHPIFSSLPRSGRLCAVCDRSLPACGHGSDLSFQVSWIGTMLGLCRIPFSSLFDLLQDLPDAAFHPLIRGMVVLPAAQGFGEAFHIGHFFL